MLYLSIDTKLLRTTDIHMYKVEYSETYRSL